MSRRSKKIAKLRKEKNDLISKVGTLETEKSDLASKIGDLKAEKEELSIKNINLKVGINNKDIQLAQYDDYVASLREKAENMRESLEKYRANRLVRILVKE